MHLDTDRISYCQSFIRKYPPEFVVEPLPEVVVEPVPEAVVVVLSAVAQ